LDIWDREDERLKKEQLRLSRNTRYIHVNDVGHDIIDERPDLVVEEVRWVIEHLDVSKQRPLWSRVMQDIMMKAGNGR